jgi:hypothetical protein
VSGILEALSEWWREEAEQYLYLPGPNFKNVMDIRAVSL